MRACPSLLILDLSFNHLAGADALLALSGLAVLDRLHLGGNPIEQHPWSILWPVSLMCCVSHPAKLLVCSIVWQQVHGAPLPAAARFDSGPRPQQR